MKQSLFSGTRESLRFMLRRDRIRLTVWVLAISILTIAMAPYYADMYPTAEARAMMAESMKNPAMALICGPVYSADNYHNGAMMSGFMLLFMAAIVAVMNIFLITRHTRQDEETGRMEVIRSLPVGKLGNAASAMLLAVIANIVMTLLIGLGITACGIEDMGFLGSMTFAAAMGAVGIFFAALTLVCCQLTANNRTAVGISIALAGASYLLRGIGDSGNIKVLTYTSPFGLAHLTEAYVSDYWWPIFTLLVAAALISILAFYLGSIRDLGAGLLPARPGKKTASPMLNSPFGLSVRLLRGSAVTWVVIVLVLCAVLGSLFGDLETLVADNEMMAAYFAKTDFTIIEEFLTLLMAVIAIISTIPSVSFLMKLRSEEKNGYTEHLLSRSVSRIGLFAGNFALAILNAVVLSVIGTVSLWAIASATIDGVPELSNMFMASLHYVPAVWLMVGLSAALIGIFPKATSVAYGYLGYCFLALFTVMMFGLPEWIGRLSPYAYVPQIPLEDASPVVAVVLIGITVVLSIAGFIGYRKRDAVFF